MGVGLIKRIVNAWAFFFLQAEDGIRDLVRSRGLGDVYKRQLVVVVRRDVQELLGLLLDGAHDMRMAVAGGVHGLSLIHI